MLGPENEEYLRVFSLLHITLNTGVEIVSSFRDSYGFILLCLYEHLLGCM